MTNPDWDDDRLKAAFLARAAAVPPIPSDLAGAATRIAAGRPRSRGGPARLAPLLGIAAAVTLALVVGVSQLGRSPDPPGQSGSTGSPPPQALIGAPISIDQATAIRDGGADDRELVVDGFFAQLFLPCPAPPPDRLPNPTRMDCEESLTWLMKQPEPLSSTSGNTTSIHQPLGPAIHPGLGMVETAALRGGATGPSSSATATMIGHFDDRRAALCEAAERAACADTFIVDRLLSFAGAPQPVSTLLANTRWDDVNQVTVTLDPVTAEEAVDRLVEAASPGATVLSRQLRTGEELAAVEPALRADASWTGRRLVWIIATVSLVDDRPTPRTFLIVDGTSVVDEITAAGVIPRSDASASPAPDASASPESSASSDAGIKVVDGLLADPISVSDAIDHRDRHLDDTELAIEGFAWGPTGPIACPMIRPGMPAALQCPSTFTWVADQKPAAASGSEFPQPGGPHFNLVISPETIRQVSIYEREAVHVIVLGHFDDHRAGSCAPDQVEVCRRNFIVDALLSPDDRRLIPGFDDSISQLEPTVRPLATAEQALGLMNLPAIDGQVLRVFAVRAAALAEVEPQAAAAGKFAGTDVVWIARWIENENPARPVLRTRIVADGHPFGLGMHRWYDVTRDGLSSNFPPP